MSWQQWADELRHDSQQAVADLLRGAADVGPFDRISPHEFLLAVLPRNSRNVTSTLLGEPQFKSTGTDATADLPAYLDSGMSAWLLSQREAPQPPAKKLGAYAAQVCEALQWPLYFSLPKTRAALQTNRIQWLQWLGSLTLSAYRDPEYDFWQVLASQQADDQLQFFWQSFVVEAGRTRSARYLNLGLLALARLPLSEDDSLRPLRLQVQSLINRYQRRKTWGTSAQEELAQALRGVMAHNPSMSAANYREFLYDLLSPLGENKKVSVLSMLGLAQSGYDYGYSIPSNTYKLEPPGHALDTDEAVRAVRQSGSLAEAWKVIRPLISAHEDYLHKSGDAYHFVRTLDKCGRALCKKYPLRDPEVRDRLFQWIHLSLHVDAETPTRWMLWELALRQADQTQRSQWVLWEMTRRFPDQLPCRVELARLLAAADTDDDNIKAHRLLLQVLQMDPDNLHAHSTLAQLAIRREDWPQALIHAQQGLQIDPSDQPSILLLAAAYARRNGPGDLQTAIDHLQRFVTHYRGELRAANYLQILQQRQQLAAEDQPPVFEIDEETENAGITQPETNPAWRAFAESIRSWVGASSTEEGSALYTEDEDLIDRVLPLPQALRQAVTQNRLDSDVLDRYELAVQQEFPLETRLWRYLQTFQPNFASDHERDHAKQDMQTWLEAETQAPSQDNNPSWLPYLDKQWQALNSPSDVALPAGSEWLKNLLDRHQPLPAPIFE